LIRCIYFTINTKWITEEIKTNNVDEGMSVASTTQGDLVSAVSHIADNFYSGVRTRTAIETPFLYTQKPSISSVPESLKMDFSRILNKPFFVKNISWRAVDTTHSIINNIGIPSEILLNTLAKIPFQSSSFFRAKVALILQVAGTPMHQGIVLASAIPRVGVTVNNNSLVVNRSLAAPHVFLSANEATPVILEVPFYSAAKLRNVDLLNTTVGPEPPTLDYAQVAIQVISPLAVSAGGSSTVTISVHAVFMDMDFYVPHTDPNWVAQGFISDIKNVATRGIDGTFGVLKQVAGDLLDTLRKGANNGLKTAREAIRSYTGLHSPEIPTLQGRIATQNRQNVNLVDAPSYFEKMDPFSMYTRIVDDYIFDTDIDEMDMKFILSKPQFLGSFKVSYNTPVDTLLWSRPITPVQLVYESPPNNYSGLGNATFSNWSSSLLQNFSYLSKYWKGSLKLHIQFSASSMSFAKLAIVRNYSPDSRMLTNAPAYADVQNLLTEHIEFSSGGQVQTVELPFCSTLSELPCTTDWTFNVLQHGMYYIYLAQPLTINSTIPNDVRFNIYLSAGDDFTFMGYATKPVEIAYPYLQTNAIRSEEEHEFRAEATSSFPVNSQDDLLNKREEKIKPDLDIDFRPIVSVRDYIRRFHKVYSDRFTYEEITENGGVIRLDVAELTGCQNYQSPGGMGFPGFNADIFGMPSNPLSLINNMYYGYSGGFKFKVNLIGLEFSEIWYVPPDYSYNSTTQRWLPTVPVLKDTSLVLSYGEALLETFKFPSNGPVLLSRFNPRLSNPTVEIDRPNYYIGSSYSRMGETDLLAMSHQFEFEVPNMTPFRFIADNAKSFHASGVDAINSSGNLGYLVIRVSPTLLVPPTDTKNSAAVEIYVAATDEGRFGYQVAAPILSIPTAPGPIGSNNNYQLVPAINIQDNTPPFVIPRAFVSGAYKGSYFVA